MNEFNFSVPQNIIVGRGSMAKLPEVAKKMGGKHAFIISGPHLKKMGLVEKAAESLRAEGILVDDFTDIEGNPSVTTVEAATEAFQASGADFIVAFGGGSPMDVAKAVGVVALPNMKGHIKCRAKLFHWWHYRLQQEPVLR